MPDVVVELQEPLRPELKDPLGPIFTDAADLLAAAEAPLVTVGDVVTYHVVEAGRTPTLALVDDRTERTDVDDEIAAAIAAYDGFDREVAVSNPAATLTAGLLEAVRDGLAGAPDRSTLLVVDGEEDLAALPVIAALEDGGSVVYGQPGEGMVLVTVDEETRAGVVDILDRMDGDPARVFEVLDIDAVDSGP